MAEQHDPPSGGTGPEGEGAPGRRDATRAPGETGRAHIDTDHDPAGPGREDADARREGAEWGERAGSEPRWPASLAVAAAVGLYVVLPNRLITGLGPRWLVPTIEGLLGVALLVASPRRMSRESARLRTVAIVLIAFVNVANVVSLGQLVHELLAVHPGNAPGGRALIYASAPVWLTNVLVFGLWYWELDRGGPAARLRAQRRQPDFLFPQMTAPAATTPDWAPMFLDYLYVSFTNATAFSPTDTMPLTAWAKILMMVQSLASLLTVALVISRAVNILG